jgi:hypothetical protein
MQQFIPFEDDWDALDQLDPSALIPFHIGLADTRQPPSAPVLDQRTVPRLASIASTSPTRAPMRLASPAASSRT